MYESVPLQDFKIAKSCCLKLFIITIQRMDQGISLSLSRYQSDSFLLTLVLKLFPVERMSSMAPLWQLCERGDLEGVIEALAQVVGTVVEDALRKLQKS